MEWPEGNKLDPNSKIPAGTTIGEYFSTNSVVLDNFLVTCRCQRVNTCTITNNNNTCTITYGIECVWGMPSLSTLSSIDVSLYHLSRNKPTVSHSGFTAISDLAVTFSIV